MDNSQHPGGLSHLDASGAARMVDVSEKTETARVATAEATVRMAPETLALIQSGGVPKGDVIATARLAGIMAAKRTPDLIPLCHPLAITGVTVDLTASGDDALRIEATVKTTGKTGTFAAADYADFQAQIAEATQAVEEVSLVPANQAKELTTKAEAGK